MTKTKYQPENAEFSNLAHICAKLLIYPKIFGTNKLTFESTSIGKNKRDSIYDGEMGIDRIVYVVAALKMPLKFTIQERFRKIEYTHYRDITITEWNHNSDLPSELYKINAGIFLYGYFDKINLSFGETILINTVDLLYDLVLKKVKYSQRSNAKNQTFFAFSFDNLKPMYHLSKTNSILDYNYDWSLPTPNLATALHLSPDEVMTIQDIINSKR